MSNITFVRPEDILPDGVDSTVMNGQAVRKGTVAAFIANIDILEDTKTSAEQKQSAMQILRELAPAVRTVGLHKHVTFKNPLIEQLFEQLNDPSC